MEVLVQRRTLLLAGLIPLVACRKERTAALPAPRPLTADAVAEFCGMDVLEHPGPKGQIFTRSRPDPYWFGSVRDAVAFTLLPEMPKDIIVVWVSDMAKARSWDRPDAWVAAKEATFVIGSRRRSGMETDEAVPFSDAEAARRFAADQGGRLVRLDQIPQSYIIPEGSAS